MEMNIIIPADPRQWFKDWRARRATHGGAWYRGLGPKTAKARFAVCKTCQLRHQLTGPDIDKRMQEFALRHIGHALDIFSFWGPDQYLELLALAPNADVKASFQGAQTMTVTNLHSKASSVTAGWQSAAVDYSSNLYLDDLWFFVFSIANTTPANSKGAYLFAAHSIDAGSVYTNPYTGSEGSLTLLDVTANQQAAPSLGFVPITTADEVAESKACSMAATVPGPLPDHASVGVMNHSGAALDASGNTVKHNGVYATVV